MEALLARFRNLTVLLVAIVAQLLYLGYQVKTQRDERLIRVWAVTAVTPMAGIVEAVRHNTIGFLEDYFILLDVRDQNRKLKSNNDRLMMENNFYRNQLTTAEHARALVQFQAQTPSRTIAARVIGNSTVASAKAVFIDRGSTSHVEAGMAVVTPEGIIGKVVAVYPLVSQVLLITDPTFKVGVESQRGHVHGVLDCGSGKCIVEQIQNEDKVDTGEWFYTSGEDRVFPKGFPVGKAISSQPGQGMRDIKLSLSGAPGSAEEVLVVLQGIHQALPAKPPDNDALSAKMLPPPPPEAGHDMPVATKPQTEADKILQKYDELGKEQGHAYGAVGSSIPNFNLKPAAGTAPGSLPSIDSGSKTQSQTAGAASGSVSGANASTIVKKEPALEPAAAPTILGARPVKKQPSAAAPLPAGSTVQPAYVPNPNVPLGAPHRKQVEQPKSSDTASKPQ